MDTLMICQAYTNKHDLLLKEKKRITNRYDDKIFKLQQEKNKKELEIDDKITNLREELENEILAAKELKQVVTTYEIMQCNLTQG